MTLFNSDSRKVSVIIPTYKRDSDVVGAAIESVLQQTYDNIEIVLVDDNAKTEHAEFRESVKNMVSSLYKDRIIYIQNDKNLGGSLSRNVGIEASSGDFIAFLDDDDKYLPQKIENQLRYMTERDLDMSFTPFYVCNENDEIVDYRFHDNIKKFDNDYLLRYHLTKTIACTDTFMYKSSSLKRIGGFDDKPCGQEYHLMLKTIINGLKIGYAKDSFIVLYRKGQDCITSRAQSSRKESTRAGFKEYFHVLSFREMMYIRFYIHYEYMLIYKRQKKYAKFMLEVILASLSSPLDVIQSLLMVAKKKIKLKELNSNRQELLKGL